VPHLLGNIVSEKNDQALRTDENEAFDEDEMRLQLSLPVVMHVRFI